MTTKNWDKSVARLVQEMAAKELGKPPSYTYCLRVVQQHKLDVDRPSPLTQKAYAAFVFDKEYP